MCIIYTDGSCLKNPGGPGGWAFKLYEPEQTWLVSGCDPSTTNNRMELKAVIEAIKFSYGDSHIVYTDSKWVVNCATGVWGRKANLDMWTEFDSVMTGKTVVFRWVKAHNGDPDNETVDKLARAEATQCNKK